MCVYVCRNGNTNTNFRILKIINCFDFVWFQKHWMQQIYMDALFSSFDKITITMTLFLFNPKIYTKSWRYHCSITFAISLQNISIYFEENNWFLLFVWLWKSWHYRKFSIKSFHFPTAKRLIFITHIRVHHIHRRCFDGEIIKLLIWLSTCLGSVFSFPIHLLCQHCCRFQERNIEKFHENCNQVRRSQVDETLDASNKNRKLHLNLYLKFMVE